VVQDFFLQSAAALPSECRISSFVVQVISFVVQPVALVNCGFSLGVQCVIAQE
jgi:hypothetical protein